MGENGKIVNCISSNNKYFKVYVSHYCSGINFSTVSSSWYSLTLWFSDQIIFLASIAEGLGEEMNADGHASVACRYWHIPNRLKAGRFKELLGGKKKWCEGTFFILRNEKISLFSTVFACRSKLCINLILALTKHP